MEWLGWKRSPPPLLRILEIIWKRLSPLTVRISTN